MSILRRILRNRAFRSMLLAMFLPVAGARSQESPFSIERLSGDHWRVSVKNSEPHVLPPIEERPYSVVSMPGYVSVPALGAASMPLKRFVFALPHGGGLSVSVLSSEELQDGAKLGIFSSGSSAIGDVSSGGARSQLAVGAKRTYKGITEQSVDLWPARRDTGSGELFWLRSITFDVRITGIPAAAAAPPPGSDPAFASFINGADAAAWKIPGVPAVAPSMLNATSHYLKILTREEGIHRLTRKNLTDAGISVDGLDPRGFKLFFMGREHPLLVRGEEDGVFDEGDAIEFFAPRREGERGEYFDFWSDEQAFFLSWGDGNGLRFRPADGTPHAEPPMTSHRERLRLEEDHYFHFGDHDESDGNTTEYLPGKTWMWRYLLKKDSLEMPFSLRAPAPGPASLSFQVKHSSRDPVRVRVSLNDVVLTEYDIRDYAISERTVEIPDGLLRDGGNRLVFLNAQIVECPPANPTCTIERMYVNWAELSSNAQLRARGGRLLLDGAADGDTSGAAKRVEVADFETPDITALNLSDTTFLTGLAVSGGGASYAASAAVNENDKYFFYQPQSAAEPAGFKLVSPPDLKTDALDRDYIVITHTDFDAAARRLAAYRQSVDGHRVFVASVEDVYDVFNHGLKHPRAIKEMLRYCWINSSEPKPRFALLFGDASWDPKRLAPSSVKTDFVPTYGNPVSDNWFVMFGDDSLDVTPWMSIGRIPAETAADADGVVDKIIEYESLPPSASNNRFLFSVGGKSVIEQDFYLKPPVEHFVSKWMTPNCFDPRVIVKRSPELPVSYDDLDTLVAEADRGVAWFFFIGHGGTRIIDVGIDRPELFTLKGKYPFFLTMSCNTAHFAEPHETGLNEKFAMAADNGAIASYGTSGLGEIGHDNILSEGLMEGAIAKNVRTFGELSTYGKLKLISSTGTGSNFTRSTVHQYIILGDPATRIPLPPSAEPAVEAADLSTDPVSPTQLAPATVRAVIRNYGRCLEDSLDVRLVISQQGASIYEEARRIPPFLLNQSIEWPYVFRDVVGTVDITVALGPRGLPSGDMAANNSATIRRTVLPRGIRQIFPLENAALRAAPGDTVVFLVANPSRMPDEAADPAVEVEISSDPGFASVIEGLRAEAGPAFTWLDWILPAGLPSPLYWRARLTTGQGAESWSAERAFHSSHAVQSGEVWRQSDSAQYARNDLARVIPTGAGCVLGAEMLGVEALSAGANQVEIITAVLRVGGIDHAPDKRGFNVIAMDGVSGAVTDTAVFDTYVDAATADAMAGFLNSLPGNSIIAVAVKDDANGYPPVIPGGTNITSSLRSALAAYGARLIDSVGFQDSYAFVGSREAPVASIEQWSRYGTAKAEKEIAVKAGDGRMLTARIGPAGGWGRVTWDGISAAGARVDIEVYGATPAGDTLLTRRASVQPGIPIDLSAIPADRYPWLRLAAVLLDENRTGILSLASWELDFASAFPELGITSRTVRVSEEEIAEGAPLEIEAEVYNAGRKDALDVPVALIVPGEEGRRISATVSSIPAGRGKYAEVTLSLPTAGLRGAGSWELKAGDDRSMVEYYAGNNAWTGDFHVQGDGSRPELDVRFDGIRIADNDHVAPRPVIDITLKDDSPLPLQDTSSIQIFLDGRRVWLTGNPELSYVFPPAGTEKASIRFTPDLTPARSGSMLHNLAVSGADASGNKADSIPYQVRFYVTNENGMDNVYPYPSPTRGAMDFTFRAMGSRYPDRAVVKIYTAAGRLIREVEAGGGEVRIGFNRIPWDGRDADGAELANGTYLFKLILLRDGESQEHVGTFSVLK